MQKTTRCLQFHHVSFPKPSKSVLTGLSCAPVHTWCLLAFVPISSILGLGLGPRLSSYQTLEQQASGALLNLQWPLCTQQTPACLQSSGEALLMLAERYLNWGAVTEAPKPLYWDFFYCGLVSSLGLLGQELLFCAPLPKTESAYPLPPLFFAACNETGTAWAREKAAMEV